MNRTTKIVRAIELVRSLQQPASSQLFQLIGKIAARAGTPFSLDEGARAQPIPTFSCGTVDFLR